MCVCSTKIAFVERRMCKWVIFTSNGIKVWSRKKTPNRVKTIKKLKCFNMFSSNKALQAKAIIKILLLNRVSAWRKITESNPYSQGYVDKTDTKSYFVPRFRRPAYLKRTTKNSKMRIIYKSKSNKKQWNRKRIANWPRFFSNLSLPFSVRFEAWLKWSSN